MMSRLALCLVAAVLCLPLGCLGGLQQCETQINALGGPPDDGFTNYRSYKFESAVAGDCNNLEITCEATVLPDVKLRGRTWFITNIKPNHGMGYENNVIHDFRVQCPNNTFLHLAIQNSSLPDITPGDTCNLVDFVRVGAADLPGEEVIFCGDNEFVASDPSIAPLHNNGRGRIFPDGSASVSFCSDNIDPLDSDGFVMRATCLDPTEFQLDGCADFGFFQAWDPLFVNQIFEPFPPVDRVMLPHKKRRSAAVMKQIRREKRFAQEIEKLELVDGDTVRFENGILTVSTNGTEVITIEIWCLKAHNPLLGGSRIFYLNAPFEFNGPGLLDYGTFNAWLSYSIPQDRVEEIFQSSIPESLAANRIYEYIYNNWVLPYPVIDNQERRNPDFPIFPLPCANQPPVFPDLDAEPYRNIDSLGFIQEDIQSERGDCKRAIRIELAPAFNTFVPDNLIAFCQLFIRSCDLTLKTACREILRLDPRSVGK